MDGEVEFARVAQKALSVDNIVLDLSLPPPEEDMRPINAPASERSLSQHLTNRQGDSDWHSHESFPIFNIHVFESPRGDTKSVASHSNSRCIGSGGLVEAVATAGIASQGDKWHAVVTDGAHYPRKHANAAVTASPRAQFVIFFVFCEVARAFLAFGGGATLACLDALQEQTGTGHWTASELALLVVFEQVGMVTTSAAWGRLPQNGGSKAAIITGLLFHAILSVIFGAGLPLKILLYAAKFVIGVTQALHTVWVARCMDAVATPSRSTRIGIEAVSTAVGRGFGIAVAGFATARGFSYGFPFFAQAAALVALVVFLLPIASTKLPSSLLAGGCGIGFALPIPSPTTKNGFSWERHLKALRLNRTYRWACVATSLIVFELSGVQFLWVRVCVGMWGLSKSFAITALLALVGVGNAVGALRGHLASRERACSSSSLDLIESLRDAGFANAVGTLAVVAALVCLGGRCWYDVARHTDGSDLQSKYGDTWFIVFFACFVLVWTAQTRSAAIFLHVVGESAAEETNQISASFPTLSWKALGHTLGPLLPSIVVDVAEHQAPVGSSKAVCIGLGFVFIASIAQLYVSYCAVSSAAEELRDKQDGALQQLRDALASENEATLVEALSKAKRTHLHMRLDGEAVMGMANEVVGHRRATCFHADVANRAELAQGLHRCSQNAQDEESEPSVPADRLEINVFTADRKQLQEWILRLEAESAHMKHENAEARRAKLDAEMAMRGMLPARYSTSL
eukprot:TRINITY_DN56208_c0_g1_i1.p1 TRINITY_DN56208_c0_g1~~TRINITY_DN56208_c0_g1_i1.p1  ORF type:complete len:744 (-),score=108.20 TRINITY_DN56208_c0_g1_i1:108-2339(-)